jgi:hypothetical protein
LSGQQKVSVREGCYFLGDKASQKIEQKRAGVDLLSIHVLRATKEMVLFKRLAFGKSL